MINNEKEKNDKDKIINKFLRTNNYNYMINEEREKNNKKKITIKFLHTNNYKMKMIKR